MTRKKKLLAAFLAALVVPAAVTVGLRFFGTSPKSFTGLRGQVTEEEARVRAAEVAIVRQELDQAAMLLSGLTGPEARRTRAHLLICRADCEGALQELGSERLRNLTHIDEMRGLASRCAGATIGGTIVEDKERGVWLRLQDEADVALAPMIIDAVARSLPVIERELGATLARPLRIDVVRDLFSLAAVSGLPLESAETTGTVAIAKFSRVTFLSPRAMQAGFPWEDTVAHEITHLVLAKASDDRAPLWLQEGIAKREETRWRKSRPFDREPDPARVSYQAQVSGRSVGVDKLGPSIAMLSSADAARIAFAEVTSFMEFWLRKNGESALPALLRDLKVSSDADAALRSVSGLGLLSWQKLYRSDLEARFSSERGDEEEELDELEGPALYQVTRAVDLLFLAGHPGAAASRGAPELARAPRDSGLRFAVGRAAIEAKREDARALVGDLAQVAYPSAGHLALLSRRDELPFLEPEPFDPPSISGGNAPLPESGELLAQARGLDPLLMEVACATTAKNAATATIDPQLESKKKYWQALCAQVKELPRRGTE